jgi:1,2-diacylglycerol 3-alpha-glucosyltransferase
MNSDGMPRIGQFADSFPPVINGVSAFVHEHHSELLARGCDAHVFTFGYTWHRRADEAHNVWRTLGVPIGASPFRANITLNAAAHRAAKRLDLIHIHEPFGIGWVSGRHIAWRQRKPLIFTMHTRHDIYIRNWPRWMQTLMQWQARRTIAGFVGRSTITSAPSQDTADWLRGIAPRHAERIVVSHNGVRLDQFERVRPEPRARFGVPNGTCLLMYVGRLTPEKNLPALLAAFARALAVGCDAHLVLLGDGECRAQLEALAAPLNGRVQLPGAVPRQAVPACLAAADVFATASRSEVNPVSVIEALASGLPLAGLRSDWWREFHANGHATPAVLLAADEEEMAGQFAQLAASPALRQAAGQTARALSHRFDIRNVTARWLELYRGVII